MHPMKMMKALDDCRHGLTGLREKLGQTGDAVSTNSSMEDSVAHPLFCFTSFRAMPVSTEIHLGTQTVLEYLLSPVRKPALETGRER